MKLFQIAPNKKLEEQQMLRLNDRLAYSHASKSSYTTRVNSQVQGNRRLFSGCSTEVEKFGKCRAPLRQRIR